MPQDMISRTKTGLLLFLFTTLIAFIPATLAQDAGDDCPAASEIVYSPFRPWFDFYNGSSQQCWNMASCVFIRADESRKQQFAATALVMGLIPLTLKDIAWPARRIAPVSKQLAFGTEVIVMALGLEPVVEGKARAVASRASPIARWAWGLRKRWVVALIGATAVGLAGCYASLALLEIYSKRVALGCPFPVFVLVWHLAGLVPGAIHISLSRLRQKWDRDAEERDVKMVEWNSASEHGAADLMLGGEGIDGSGSEKKEKAASPVQGSDEWWVVQLVWAIYYIAGTLIFTSIMAVTVIELFVWVVVSFAVTGTSKLLAFFLCLAFEDILW